MTRGELATLLALFREVGTQEFPLAAFFGREDAGVFLQVLEVLRGVGWFAAYEGGRAAQNAVIDQAIIALEAADDADAAIDRAIAEAER